MRLLVRDRGGHDAAFLEVERIIDWCQTDSFWHANVLSPRKLRKQFTQLSLKAKPGGNVRPLRAPVANANRFLAAPEYNDGRTA